MEILNVRDLSFTYPLCKARTIKNISFCADEGEFIAICGATGSGKSTLLRMLKPQLTPLGEKTGQILFRGKPADDAPASSIGYVMQSPEQQIVTDKVWHELAFGLENMKAPKELIARRVAEIACYFGIESWYDKPVCDLSGGQKQLLNLAGVTVTDPRILILDEPCAQLDPIAAGELITAVKKLCRDFSITVIIAEHRLEEVIPLCDKLMMISEGTISAFGDPRQVIKSIYGRNDIICAMPAAARICAMLGEEECALSIREGRELIRRCTGRPAEQQDKPEPPDTSTAKSVKQEADALCFNDVYFRYRRDLPDVLCGLTFSVKENEIFCILGGNGSGKSTTVSLASGLYKPYAGKITVFGKKLRDYHGQSLYNECAAVLPQDVQTVFLRNTVREELSECKDISSLPYDLSALYDKHPYDLSGGEQQLLALAKVLSLKPRLLFLDEPTKGLDASSKLGIIDILKKLKENGVTVVVVTHDVEFAALCADRCALFFRGRIVSCAVPEEFFSDNRFYTTAASRITRGYFDRCVTAEKAAELCRKARKRNTDDNNQQ